ncbi:hypothetical protein ACFXPJ_32635, partial [Streptomyces goshikiensis]
MLERVVQRVDVRAQELLARHVAQQPQLPSFPIEVGLERVLRVVREAAGTDPDELAAEVMRVADSTGHCDDAAVLVLSHEAAAPR